MGLLVLFAFLTGAETAIAIAELNAHNPFWGPICSGLAVTMALSFIAAVAARKR